MRTSNERGIAIILALFLVSILSVLGASLMMLSQTETYASMNYRMMSQARYAAESGVHRASSFLLDSTQYHVPTPGGADSTANYLTTASPVTYLGQPVVLSSDATFKASNYPYAPAQAAFLAAFAGAGGTMCTMTPCTAPGNTSLSYKAYATLISMQQFDSYGGQPTAVQTWEITADGGLTGSPKTTVEVVALVETPKVPANSYAAFATANTCDAIYFHGNVTVDSYDSSMGTVAATTEATGGDLGSNGNLHVQGSVNVAGNLYTPRTGVGTCTAGAVDGLTGTIGGNMVHLPTDVVYPVPVFLVTPPTNLVTLTGAMLGSTVATATTTCTNLGLTFGTALTTPKGNCDLKSAAAMNDPLGLLPGASAGGAGPYVDVIVTGSDLPFVPITLPSVSVSGGLTLTLAGTNTPGQTIDMNSLTGSGTVAVDIANTVGLVNQSVILKIAGKNPDGTDMVVPFDLSTMDWKQNAKNLATKTIDASSLQIVYGGPANISMKGGNSQSAASVYAPNASFTMQGTQDFFGSILARTITNGGNASIHYDRRLSRDFWVAGHPMIGSFTWKRF